MSAQSPGTVAGPRSIRVLIVDDRAETQQSLCKLLSLADDIEVAGTAASGEEAVGQTQELKPDIILMDIEMPGMDGITATETIVRQFPYAQVIMMSVHADADSVRRSMLAGARDFLVKPVSTNDLMGSIRRVYNLEAGRRVPVVQSALAAVHEPAPEVQVPRGRLVTVFSPKGGTGSTTVAVNLAVALRQLTSKDVALVDADLQFGDVAVLLNLQPTRSIADLALQVKELDNRMLSTVLASHSSGVKALFAPSRPELSDLVAPEHARTILERMLRIFDYVIVDTKGFLCDLVLSILDMSDRVLLVATPDIPAIKSIRLFSDVVNVLRYPNERTCLIINKADKKSALDVQDIEAVIKLPVVARLPTDDPNVDYAANEGVPFVLEYPKSPLAKGFSELAAWLVEEFSPRPGKENETVVSPAKGQKRRRRWPARRFGQPSEPR
jgi:pilus assembly protein CpaE